MKKRKKRRLEIQKERKKEEERGEIELEKLRKLEGVHQKRKNLLCNLRKKGHLKPSKRDIEWVEERKKMWRNHRGDDKEKKEEENDDLNDLDDENIDDEDHGKVEKLQNWLKWG